MSKEIYISSTPHETRLAIVESDELTEIYYERENEYTLAGSIYNGKVTRVLPGMQSSFVDIGLERDAFLYITDFMEEAADTAEFDHSGDGPRAARNESPRAEGRGDQDRGGRDREAGRNGNDRSEGYVSERSREQMSASPATDTARASEGRDEEFGGRNDRGGRGRGRGRRDRAGSGDRPASQERSSRGEGAPRIDQSPSAGSSGQTVTDEEQAFVEALPIGNSEGLSRDGGADLGEGAPGADGSRRWRGRRGRRRGRGVGPQDGIPASVAQAAELPESSRLDSEGEGSEDASNLKTDDRDGAQPSSIAHTITPLEPQQAVRSTQLSGEDRGMRQRDGRNDRSDRGGRSDRGDRSQRPARVPRGFAPNRSLYVVDSGEAEEVAYGQEVESISASGAEAEPLILPGESLSKYRKGGEESAPGVVAIAAPSGQVKPADSGFKVDAGWDGGAMLPGETLSRYRGAASQGSGSHGRADNRADTKRQDGRRDGGKERQSDRSLGGQRNDRGSLSPEASRQDITQASHEGKRQQPMMVPASVPGVDLQSSGPVSGFAHVSETAEEIQAHQPEFIHAELPQATAEAPTMDDRGLTRQPGEQHHGSMEQIDAAQPIEPVAAGEPEQDYEPEGKSVSYRVDPAAPSEYRHASPAIEELPVENEKHVEVAPSGELFSADLASDHSIVPGVLDDVRAGNASAEDHVGSSMLADLTGEAGDGGHVIQSHPVQNETVFEHEVTKIHSEGEMASAVVSEDVIGGEAAPQDFAPGAGDLEEDFIEEEDHLETTSLHAHGEDEFDDLEEEHLEGTADLGMMIREMSLDHITRTDGALAEDDEDDFEEDMLEEDSEVECQDSSNTFAAPDTDGLEEQGEGAGGFRSTPVEGAPAAIGNESRSRRENGRRGGRERSGNRDSGSRSGRSDRLGNSEGNGYSERQGSSDRGSYSDRGGTGERARNSGGSSDRDRGRSSGRGGRQSMQMTNLPAISDLLKPGQEILCQIAKEPIAKKGARITSHIALPGRFLVFMPTVSHTGVSRKIESDGERRRLKEILLSEKGEAAGGFIVRTAAAGATEEELRSDLRFLLNLWADIKQRSESSKSPALIYHDLNLVERILRDQVTDSFSAIWVDTETEYERVLRFLQRFQPGLIRRVKLYTKETPLFEQFGITEEINKALRSKVWLKSGGSIVINQTEALVAIDINTGKYVGKTARLEDTIVKTNLDAIPEIVRQIRLRDLGGIIIIDFIDMDERKNRNRVMAALEDELKTDRAPSKILPFNDFGLVAITRKRVKQSLERTLSTTCGVCTGTGMVKSPVTVCNDIYVEMRKMHKHLDRGDVMLRVNPEVVKQLKSTGTRWLQEMEEMCGKTILIKSDPSLHPEQFDIH